MGKNEQPKLLKVEATQLGYYDHKRRHEGSVFAMSEKDYYKFDPKTKKKVTMTDEEGDEVYVTNSWVKVLEENYDPASDVPKVEKKGLVKKALVQPIAPVEPKSSNPGGFAPAPAPQKAGPVNAKAGSAPAKEDKATPGNETFATHSSQGDDVI